MYKRELTLDRTCYSLPSKEKMKIYRPDLPVWKCSVCDILFLRLTNTKPSVNNFFHDKDILRNKYTSMEVMVYAL